MLDLLEQRVNDLLEQQFKDKGIDTILSNLEIVVHQIVEDYARERRKADHKTIEKLLRQTIMELPMPEATKEAVLAAIPGKVKQLLDRTE